MNRRAFFASLVAACVLDPERLLWVPGKKMISIPAPKFEPAVIAHLLQQFKLGDIVTIQGLDGRWKTLTVSGDQVEFQRV